LKHYDISADIGSIKAESILSTGCGTVATSCPACMMQISDMLAKKKKNLYVRHPVQLYADSIKKHL
jgi:glycolate oxidase iron-sulfur subunit